MFPFHLNLGGKLVRRPDKRQILEWLAALAGLLVLVLAFVLIPIPGGDDWETFHGAAQRIWTGQPLYTEWTPEYNDLYNPPWVAVLLAPLGLLPADWGLAILSVATLVLVAAVVHRWRGGILRVVLALLL